MINHSSPQDSNPAIYQAESLLGLLPGLTHGFSSNLPFSPENGFSPALRRILAGVGVSREQPLLLLDQPHSANIIVTWNSQGKIRPDDSCQPPKSEGGSNDKMAEGFDGATGRLNNPMIFGLRSADCIPVLLVDTGRETFAALHAGWRGVAAGILPNLLSIWRKEGSDLSGVRIAFGPGIGPCCFEVKDDCISEFSPDQLEGAVSRKNEAIFLNLTAVLTRQARAFGIKKDRIEALPFCTCCHQKPDGSHPFASYRRGLKKGDQRQGRNASFIGIL